MTTPSSAMPYSSSSSFRGSRSYRSRFRNACLALLVVSAGLSPAFAAGPAPPEADLTLFITADDSSAIAGQRLVYTFSVTNAGPEFAPDTELTVTLPAAVTAIGTSGCVGDPNGLPICELQIVNVSETKVVTLEVQVNDGASGSLVLQASVESSRVDPSPLDNEVELVTAIGTETVIAEGSSPAIAADPTGSSNFVIAWQDPPAAAGLLDPPGLIEPSAFKSTGSGGITAQVFSAGGVPVGVELRLDESGSTPLRPDLTRRANGQFVAVWQNDDSEESGISGRLFSAIGVPLGVELRLNSFESGEQSLPAVAALGDGRFVATWSDEESMQSFVHALRIFDSVGIPVGVEMRFGSTNIIAKPPAIAVSNSRILVTWQDAGDRIAAQLFDLNGSPEGFEFHITSSGLHARPAAAAHPDGGFVVVWQNDDGGDLDGSGILGRRINSTGVPVGVEIVLNQVTAGDQQRPAIAASPDGRFVVTWQGPDEDGTGISSLLLDNIGVPLGVELRMSQAGSGDQTSAEPAFIDADGTYYVAWQSDEEQSEIVIAPPTALFGDDFESGDLSAWDAQSP